MISPEPRLAAALELQISASARPWTRVRSWSSRCCESIALPATNPRFQPQPSRNSASSRTTPPSAGAAAARSDAVASTAVPAKIVGTAPKRSVSRPETGRQREHPERVRRQDDAHGGQVVPVLGHVERRHRHDQDHHDLADDERDDRRRDARAAQDLPDRADARARVVAGREARGLVGELVRVRAGARRRTGSRRGRRTRSARGTDPPARAGPPGRRGRPRSGPASARSPTRRSRPRPRCRSPTPGARTGPCRRPRSATAGWSCCRSRSAACPPSSSGNELDSTAAVAISAPTTPMP